MMPVVLDFVGFEPSATTEAVIRRLLAVLAPLEGWLVSAEVQLARLADGTATSSVELTLPLGRLNAAGRAPSTAPADLAEATAEALHLLLPRVRDGLARMGAGEAMVA